MDPYEMQAELEKLTRQVEQLTRDLSDAERYADAAHVGEAAALKRAQAAADYIDSYAEGPADRQAAAAAREAAQD